MFWPWVLAGHRALVRANCQEPSTKTLATVSPSAAGDPERQVVAAGARIRVGGREAVEVAREFERARRITELSPPSLL